MDDFDRKILRILQRDGRITNAALAQSIHLSPAATLERVRRLEQKGIIKGYMAILDPSSLQFGILVLVEVTLDRSEDDLFTRFANAVRTIPQITECHMVAGGFDYLLKARVKDMAAYRRFLGQTLTRLPGIRQTHTYTVMEEVKNELALPL
ncbi:MAG: Lrp/AsnC ligand binding domain-containing protein [Acetobacter sp.]|jgi:Lrp/AsnC family leucine-responsive transcriptional regulator|nr:Lrp/AsnC ligand binding domain-containing protein [Acetobacter sp.]MCH4060831.1 Lrp/AsnC ligand binding domain-containing protein [Acetobacter sp.]MCH4087771.1 Lrp/AsnC ligand binding domain-containing protein [Acetobacter sp.]MCI1293712.1 Lrp/AsnC ligand binding domain-containing protein [Acetobacter sp.]MCI1319897.1 Lrp/AsnC ligand binding domain-containing protein [Acetobacter sp.]